MLQIGDKGGQPPDDVKGMILDCHARIRDFIAMMGRLSDAEGASDADIRQTAEAIARYFEEALPLHIADEEETLVPRLEGKSDSLDTALRVMAEQHEFHDELIAAVVSCCRTLEKEPGRHSELQDDLDHLATRLARELVAHLDQEELFIIPTIAVLLSDDEQAAMVDEIRRRRDTRG